MLSQATNLASRGLAWNVKYALSAWALGVLAGVVTWLFGFVSTRYVDKSDKGPDRKAHIRISDRWMWARIVALLAAAGLFCAGSLVTAAGFGRLYGV